jgi:hypothetical protein
VTSAFVATRGRLRPVFVELSALGLHLARLGRSLAERQREDMEDLWAEVEERLRSRVAEAAAKRRPHASHTGAAPQTPPQAPPQGNGAPVHT